MTSYTEIVNLDICQKLSKLTLSQFTELFNLSSTKRHNQYNVASEYKKIKNYCSNYIETYEKKGEGNYSVQYGWAKGKENIGRLQSKNPSLQRLYNGVRGILQDGLTYDLDMKNCHPNILLKLCKEHNIPHKSLYNYIQNREEVLQQVCDDLEISRSEAKTMMLKSINRVPLTQKHNNKKMKSKTFIEFDKETSNIVLKIYEIIKNDEKFSKYDRKTEWNNQGKLVNLLLCDIENEYLQKAVKILSKMNISISTLMFDGLMIYIGEYDVDKLIKKMNKKFIEEGIEWDIKLHNTELKEPLLEMEIDESVQCYQGDDLVDVGDFLLSNVFNDKLYRSGSFYFYLGRDKIIENIITNTKQIEAELYQIIIRQDLFIKVSTEKNEDGELVPKYEKISRKPSTVSTLIKHCLNCAEIDDNFVENVWRETQFKIFFNNGYFDFKQNKFIEGEFNKTFIKVNRDFNQETNPQIREQIFNKVLNPVFSIDDKEKDKTQQELLEYFLYRMSRVIAGNIEDKRWILLQGLRNSGKGVISDILKNCFGHYVRTTNSGNFEFKRNVGDEGKALSWLIDFQFSRLAITQEINITDNNKINGNSIKKFCSGGDYFQARKNFKDEIEFKIQSALMVCCNDLPETNPTDCLEFMDEFQMKSKFIDEDFDGLKLNTFKYYKKDESIKAHFLNREDVINEFTHLIFESYLKKVKYPEVIRQENKSNDDGDDYETLFDLFKITAEKKDFISNKELKTIIQQSNIPFTIKKVKMLLKTKGAVEHKKGSERGLGCISRDYDHESEDEDENDSAFSSEALETHI